MACLALSLLFALDPMEPLTEPEATDLPMLDSDLELAAWSYRRTCSRGMRQVMS